METTGWPSLLTNRSTKPFTHSLGLYRHDLAGENPEKVAPLRADYDGWWQVVSGRVAEEIPMAVGDPEAERVLLTAHVWRRPGHPDPPRHCPYCRRDGRV